MGESPPPIGVTGETLPLLPLSMLDIDEGLLRERDSTNEFLSMAADWRFSRRSEVATDGDGMSPDLLSLMLSMLDIGNGGGKNLSPRCGRCGTPSIPPDVEAIGSWDLMGGR